MRRQRLAQLQQQQAEQEAAAKQLRLLAGAAVAEPPAPAHAQPPGGGGGSALALPTIHSAATTPTGTGGGAGWGSHRVGGNGAPGDEWGQEEAPPARMRSVSAAGATSARLQGAAVGGGDGEGSRRWGSGEGGPPGGAGGGGGPGEGVGVAGGGPGAEYVSLVDLETQQDQNRETRVGQRLEGGSWGSTGTGHRWRGAGRAGRGVGAGGAVPTSPAREGVSPQVQPGRVSCAFHVVCGGWHL